MLQRDYRAWVEIDPQALTHNIQVLKHWIGPRVHLLAVVKADAYGHGAVSVSETALASGVSWLGVATIEEGMALRRAGIRCPILLMGATNSPEEVQEVVHWHLQPTLCTPRQALTYAETLRAPLPVHLKIDTGMSRLGTRWEAGLDFIRLVHRLPLLQPQGIYSHLATTRFEDGIREQVERFDTVLAQAQTHGMLPPLVHLANSAGTLLSPRLHHNLVRVGVALYGLSPEPHLAHLPLQPVMSVKARITQVQEVPTGTGVSYGQIFVTVRPSTLATVAIGYADGVPRNLSNRIQVLVHGRPVPQVGAITMDQCVLDVTGMAGVQPGDVATFLGPGGGQTAEAWAEALGTISYEILCGFKHRLPRLVLASVPSH
ncbi:alanine racemase [Candidatus Cyanaurora vandensis]|uniref:alanine racemase n=1 Tax=Candidatus Cyanaurora vandensis TaxID=2714958 RepID=UPI00257AFE07|nr:alanine racemase [Candidatus Cyanaurora vandensis]